MKFNTVTDGDLINREKWSDFVFSHPQGSVFQTPEYFFAFHGLEDDFSECVALLDDANEILGLVVAIIHKEGKGPKGFFSRRAIVMGSPLVKENDENLMDQLLSALNFHLSKRVIYTQFRNMFDMERYRCIFNKNGYTYEEHLDILIDLKKSE